MPCQNGSLCSDSNDDVALSIGDYKCHCAEGWEGENCAAAEPEPEPGPEPEPEPEPEPGRWIDLNARAARSFRPRALLAASVPVAVAGVLL